MECVELHDVLELAWLLESQSGSSISITPGMDVVRSSHDPPV